jgi:hypothetical protein
MTATTSTPHAASAMLRAADALDGSTARFAETRFTIGFDGFVDEILHAVATRRDKDTFERIATIPEFAARIAAAAGKSANIELVPDQVKPGGNGPLMSMAVSGMGGRVTCVSAIRNPCLCSRRSPNARRCSRSATPAAPTRSSSSTARSCWAN